MDQDKSAEVTSGKQQDDASGAFGREVLFERRKQPRQPPKTLDDARAIVKAIGDRRVENDRRVRVWRLIERSVYLIVLVGAFLAYYLLDKMTDVMTLPGIGF